MFSFSVVFIFNWVFFFVLYLILFSFRFIQLALSLLLRFFWLFENISYPFRWIRIGCELCDEYLKWIFFPLVHLVLCVFFTFFYFILFSVFIRFSCARCALCLAVEIEYNRKMKRGRRLKYITLNYTNKRIYKKEHTRRRIEQRNETFSIFGLLFGCFSGFDMLLWQTNQIIHDRWKSVYVYWKWALTKEYGFEAELFSLFCFFE